MKRLVVNAWQTPDGTVLESRYRHDFVAYGSYFVDGGLDYCRTSGNMTFVGCYEDSPHEEIREKFSWGSYGKDGKQEKHYILLKSLSDLHIDAILETQSQVQGTVVEKVLKDELIYRSKNGTPVSDNP